MTQSEKIKAYFKERQMSNRDVSIAMDGYSESMISRYMNSNVLSKKFIDNIRKYFPEIDLNYILKDDAQIDMAHEYEVEYKTRNAILIEEIRVRLEELSKNVSRS